MVKKSASDVSISSGTHGQYSILQTARLLPGAPQQAPKARMGISKPYNVKQIKTTNAQEAEAAIRCLLEARGGAPGDALNATALRDPGPSKSEPSAGVAPLLPRRPAPRVPAIKKPTLRRTGKPESPEDQCGPQTVHFTIGPPETSPETSPLAAAPPVPKPRSLQPGKGAERKPSGGPLAPDDAPAAAAPPPPREEPPPAPRAPPRRKKSAPAAFHLQVLQSSDGLQALVLGSPDGHRTPARPPDDDSPLSPPAAGLGPSPAASPDTHGATEPRAETASLLGDCRDPFWSLLHHPSLPKNAWLSQSNNPPDSGTRGPPGTPTAPAAQELPSGRGRGDVGACGTGTGGDKDQRTVLQVFDPLANT